MIKRHGEKRKKRMPAATYTSSDEGQNGAKKYSARNKNKKKRGKKITVSGRGKSFYGNGRSGKGGMAANSQLVTPTPKKVPHMSMSVKCMVFCDGDILLLQKKDREGLRPWEFPGGGLEFGEDLKAAAIREVREETGLAVKILDVAGLWSFARTKTNFLTGVIFIAEAAHKKVRLSHEHTDFAWVRPSEFHTYRLQKSLRTALEAIRDTSPRGNELRHYFVKSFQ